MKLFNARADSLFLDRVILFSILSTSILYSLFMSSFAEIHAKFSFLDFPVFVGEFLLAGCSLLFMLKIWMCSYRPNRWAWVGLIYFVWIVLMALAGYWEYSALAFRNAALFYYALFAFLVYEVVDTDSINPFICRAVTILLGLLFLSGGVSKFYSYVYMAIFLITLPLVRGKGWFWGCFFLWVLALFLHGQRIILGGRAQFFGVVMACMYVGICLIFAYRKRLSKKYVLAVIMAGTLLVSGAIVFHPKKARIKTVFDIKTIFEKYKWYKRRAENGIIYKGRAVKGIHEYKMQKLEPQLYSGNTQGVMKTRLALFIDNARLLFYSKNTDDEKIVEQLPLNVKIDRIIQADQTAEIEPSVIEKSPKAPQWDQQVVVAIAYNNAAFRLLIWGDMLNDLKQVGFWYGVGFGRPQRSISLEVLRWGKKEWERDGWITPHNSFFHMIYRCGIAGLMIVFFVFGCAAKLTKKFIQLRSFKGILLVSILVYFMVLASFGVVLELPHYAIPFWSLFGLTFAYEQRLVKQPQ